MKKELTVGVQNRFEIRIDEKCFSSADGKEFVAIRNLEFEVEMGSFTCLIGPSGCGKTSTLRIILGLDKNYTGSVNLHRDRRLAAVFQNPLLLPWRTVEQNVRLALPEHLQNKHLSNLFETLGLSELRGRFPSELSLGQARRVALARAFAVEPEILVLDEAFVSIDENTAQKLRLLLLKLWMNNPITILMVTHNIREAITLADHLILVSPAPGHVLGQFSIPVPRDQRSSEMQAKLIADLAEIYPGIVQT